MREPESGHHSARPYRRSTKVDLSFFATYAVVLVSFRFLCCYSATYSAFLQLDDCSAYKKLDNSNALQIIRFSFYTRTYFFSRLIPSSIFRVFETASLSGELTQCVEETGEIRFFIVQHMIHLTALGQFSYVQM